MPQPNRSQSSKSSDKNTSQSCKPCSVTKLQRIQQDVGSAKLKSSKRSHSEAFFTSCTPFPSKDQKLLFDKLKAANGCQCSASRKNSPLSSLFYTATPSANINENNDKLTDSTRGWNHIEDKQTQVLSSQNRPLKHLSSANKSTAATISSPAAHLLGTDSDALVVLEKLARKASNAKNKRRYCNDSSSVNDHLPAIDKEVLKRFFLLEEEFREEILSSPPPQIPRLFRRSQSAFGQARDAAQSKLISSPATPCYKRFHSWSNGFASSPQPCSDHSINPPRVSSAPVDLCFKSALPSVVELNSNANATPHDKFSSQPNVNLFSGELPKVTSLNFGPSKTFPRTSSKSSRKEQFDSALTAEFLAQLKSKSRAEGQFGQTSPAHSFERFPADKDIENLARLKVDSTKTNLACSSCQKKSCSKSSTRQGGSSLVTESKDIHNLARQRHSNDSLGSHSDHCKGQDFRSLPQIVRNTVDEKEKLKIKYSIAEYQRNLSFFKKEVPEVLANLFAQRENKPKRLCGIEGATKAKVQHKPSLGSSFADFLSRTRNKQLHSSSNNHNIREELFIRKEENHNRKSGCCSLKTVPETSNPFQTCVDFKACGLFSKSSSSQESSSRTSYVQTDMGCMHSVSQKKRVEPCRSSIFSDVRATIDQSPTIIEEYSPIVLRYRTPYFRAHAQVIMPPIRNKETWTVGWIQACDYMKFINQYGDLGYSSWEIPALKANKVPAVSDSDGVSYPWYGNTTEIATIVGPTDSYTRMNLTMNDNFYPSVTWDIPVSEGTNAHLTDIVRDQSFITWLAAINETTKEIIILKTVRWSFYLEIKIDPSRKLGQRARVVNPPIQNQPSVSNGPCEKHHVGSATKIRRHVTNNSNSNCLNHIPITALVRPSANNAQTLIWRPTHSEPIVVVPPKEEHRDSNELVLFNGCSAMHGKEAIMREISRQELIQLQQLPR